VEQNVLEYVDWIRDQQVTSDYLEQADRLMEAQGVVRRAASTPSASRDK
jgi:hypothetical protein